MTSTTEAYFETLKTTYFSNHELLSSFLPNFDRKRFNFVAENPKLKKIKSEQQPFNKVFNSIVYSKIGSELANDRRDNLVDNIFSEVAEKKSVTGLYTACALLQMSLDDEKQQVGAWIDPFECNLCEGVQFKRQIGECCALLSLKLLARKQERCGSKDVDETLLRFNRLHGTSLTLAELVFLQVLNLYEPSVVKDYMTDYALSNVVVFFPDMRPIEQLFVPNFRSNSRSNRKLKWTTDNGVFDSTPQCVNRYNSNEEPIRFCNFKTKTLLMQLSKDMKPEWIASVFLRMNFGYLFRKHNLYSHLISSSISTQLIFWQHPETNQRVLCVAFDNEDDNMFDFCDLICAVELEKTNDPGYAFISSTLGPYLRILARIDPKLKVPLNDGVFFTFSSIPTTQLFFNALKPTKTKEETAADEQRQVQEISKSLSEFVIQRGWVDVSGFMLPKGYEVDQMHDLFNNLRPLLNDNTFIDAGAKFLSKVFQLEFCKSDVPYILFDKSVEECQAEFDVVFTKIKG